MNLQKKLEILFQADMNWTEQRNVPKKQELLFQTDTNTERYNRYQCLQ